MLCWWCSGAATTCSPPSGFNCKTFLSFVLLFSRFNFSPFFRLRVRRRRRRRHTASINYKVKLKLNSTPNNASCCKGRCQLARSLDLCLDLLGLCFASALCFVFRLDLSCLSVALAPVRALLYIYHIYLYSISMLAATNAASLLPPSPSLSLVLDGAQVCLPMVAIHYHAGDIFVLASESSCQQKPIIVILSLKCCHCH